MPTTTDGASDAPLPPSPDSDRAVLFVGAGPGAADLITVRGQRALAEADVLLYAGSLVSHDLLAACRGACQRTDSAGLTLDEQVTLMANAWADGLRVVRLHSGDPGIYGAIAEQMRLLAARGVPCRVIPGVTSACAAAAALGVELTVPEVSQSVVITRSRGRTPLPRGQEPAAFGRTGATLAFYLSAAHFSEVTDELMTEAGMPADTPAAVVERATWDDQRIARGTLGDIARLAAEAGMGRQALLLVGSALAAGADAVPKASRLYDAGFSHGYRNTLAEETFTGRVAFHTFSERALRLARTMAAALDEKDTTVFAPGCARHRLTRVWQDYDAHVFVGASGIAVRLIAPLLHNKVMDPACVSVDEDGRFVVSLIGGHLGGANRLARRLARVCGGQAVVSTGSDTQGYVAFDEAAAREGARVMGTAAVLAANSALLHGRPVTFRGPGNIHARYWKDVPHVSLADASFRPTGDSVTVWWDAAPPAGLDPARTLVIDSRAWVLGCGCRRGVEPSLLEGQALAFLARHGVDPAQVARVATIDVKQDEPAMVALARRLGGGSPRVFTAAELDAVEGVTRSDVVRARVGTGSVCEAAALLAARKRAEDDGAEPGRTGARLAVPKEKVDGSATFALARLPHIHTLAARHAALARTNRAARPSPFAAEGGSIVVAGLGSGQPGSITPEVRAAIEACDVIAGYTTYVDYVRDLAAGKERVESGMRGEIRRCTQALEKCLEGKKVCLVCSGDPGILAMAGLVYELKFREERFHPIPVRVLPGVTAASLAAAAAGAPLQNGFCLVSLSDLLVPADEVRQNLAAAAKSRLSVALYNPAGRRRRALLAEALAIMAAARGGACACALVRHAGQPEQEVWTGRLDALDRDAVDMASLLIIGTDRTRIDEGVFYDPRGYVEKYLDGAGQPRAKDE